MNQHGATGQHNGRRGSLMPVAFAKVKDGAELSL